MYTFISAVLRLRPMSRCSGISRRAIYRPSYSGRKRGLDGPLAQMASEEINQPFMVLIFRVAAEPMPLAPAIVAVIRAQVPLDTEIA
jgi:hypothetical protein